jgi:hypothetical protein
MKNYNKINKKGASNDAPPVLSVMMGINNQDSALDLDLMLMH